MILFGGGGHARSVCSVLLENGVSDITVIDFDVSAYARKYFESYDIECRQITSYEQQFEIGQGLDVFVAIGENNRRAKLLADLKERKNNVVSIISNMAYTALTSRIEAGCFIGPRVIIQAGSRLRSGVIVNSGAVVEHDCALACCASIGSGSVLAGNVSVGSQSSIGVGTVVKPNIIIGDQIMVGAGAVVTNHLLEKGVYVGCPAHQMRAQSD